MEHLRRNAQDVPAPAPHPDQSHAEQRRAVHSLPQRLFLWLRRNWQIVCLLLLFLVMHLYVLSFVDDVIYDEYFWIPEAKHILDREPLDWPNYPALSKIFTASGIFVLGDNSWGWRMPSVVFGVLSVVLVYLITDRLAGKRTALLASLLMATENITFTMTGLAMLDVPAVAFMLLSFLLYLKGRYALSGFSLALAVVCSPKAILGLAAILGHWLLTRRKRGVSNLALFAVIALTGFLVLTPTTDFIATGQWSNPFTRVFEMWSAQTSLKVGELPPFDLEFTQPTRPWWWIIDPRGFVLEPTSFRHFIMITPTLWILIMPALAYLLYRYLFTRQRRNAARFILLWFASTYLLWIPLSLITDRPMFLYYLFPTMGALCIAVAYAIRRIWQQSYDPKWAKRGWLIQASVTLYLCIHVALFLFLSPLLAALSQD